MEIAAKITDVGEFQVHVYPDATLGTAVKLNGASNWTGKRFQ